MNKLTYIETEERRREVGKRSQCVRVKHKTKSQSTLNKGKET